VLDMAVPGFGLSLRFSRNDVTHSKGGMA